MALADAGQIDDDGVSMRQRPSAPPSLALRSKQTLKAQLKEHPLDDFIWVPLLSAYPLRLDDSAELIRSAHTHHSPPYPPHWRPPWTRPPAGSTLEKLHCRAPQRRRARTAYSEEACGFYRRRHVADVNESRGASTVEVPAWRRRPSVFRPDARTDSEQTALDFVPCLYAEPLRRRSSDGTYESRICSPSASRSSGFVRLHYPAEHGTIASADVCRHYEVAKTLLNAEYVDGHLLALYLRDPAAAEAELSKRKQAAEAEARQGEEARVMAEQAEAAQAKAAKEEAFQREEERTSIWPATAPGSPPPRPRGLRLAMLTRHQVERESESARREYLGVSEQRLARGRGVPPISLSGDRIWQRAVSSLLFARPSEVALEEVKLDREPIRQSRGSKGAGSGDRETGVVGEAAAAMVAARLDKW